MIIINRSSAAELTDCSVVSACMLGVSTLGTGLSVISVGRPASTSIASADVPVRERNERPIEALEAVKGQAHAYAFAAAGAGSRKQTTQHHLMWAFRGPEPWSDPA